MIVLSIILLILGLVVFVGDLWLVSLGWDCR